MIYLLYLYLFSVRKCLVNSTTFAYSEVFPSLPGYIKPVEIEVRKCEMKISPDTLINKKWHRHQRFLASKCEWGLLKLRSSGCWWLLRSWGNARSKVNKETGLAPDSWGACERNEFSESRGLHLPIYRVLNSLTWYLIFDVQTVHSLCYKLVYSLTSPPASLEQFSQSYWDAVPGSVS